MQEKTIEKVRNFISSNQMLQNGVLVIAGVSGGADSMTMLDILWKLREETGFFIMEDMKKLLPQIEIEKL